MKKKRDEFIHRQNVANYTQMLRNTPDVLRRKMLLSLLAEESAAALSNGWPPLLD